MANFDPSFREILVEICSYFNLDIESLKMQPIAIDQAIKLVLEAQNHGDFASIWQLLNFYEQDSILEKPHYSISSQTLYATDKNEIGQIAIRPGLQR